MMSRAGRKTMPPRKTAGFAHLPHENGSAFPGCISGGAPVSCFRPRAVDSSSSEGAGAFQHRGDVVRVSGICHEPCPFPWAGLWGGRLPERAGASAELHIARAPEGSEAFKAAGAVKAARVRRV